MLTQAGEQDHSHAIAEGGRESIQDSLSETQHMGRETEGELLGNHVDSNTEDGAVGGYQGEEDAQCLIEGRAHFLEHNLDHLHERRYHQDERDRLQELKAEGHEKILVQQVGHQGCESDDEAHCKRHSGGGGELVGNSQIGADAKELRQDDIVDEYRRYDYQQDFHITSLLYTC